MAFDGSQEMAAGQKLGGYIDECSKKTLELSNFVSNADWGGLDRVVFVNVLEKSISEMGEMHETILKIMEETEKHSLENAPDCAELANDFEKTIAVLKRNLGLEQGKNSHAKEINALHKDTKRDLGSMLAYFPSNNIYMNNLAQAIEIVHCIDHAIDRLESTDFKPEPYKTPPIKAGAGIGVTEAPRGTLFYALKVNEQGNVEYINLVIPTAQNMVNIEKDMAKIVQDNLDTGRDKERISMEVEKLVRAYDPCISCATHFLKLKWKEGKSSFKKAHENPFVLK